MRRVLEVLVVPMALAGALALRWPALRVGFLSEDFGILEGIHRRGVLDSLLLNLSSPYLDWIESFYRPVSAAVFVGEFSLFGTWAPGYHLVCLLLLLLSGLMLHRLARTLMPEARLLPAAFLFFFLCLPVHTESTSWTVAGQLDVIALFFVTATILLAVRGSLWSLPLALLAYGSKESAFGMAAFLPIFVRLLPAGPERKRIIALSVAHAVLGVAAFFSRRFFLGELALPYGAGTPGELVRRLLGAVANFPGAVLTAFGAFACALLVLLWIASLLSLRRHPRSRRETLERILLPPLAFVAFSAPLLTLPLEAIRPTENARVFVPAALAGLTVLLPLATSLATSRLLPPLVLIASAGAALETHDLQPRFAEMSRACEETLASIRRIPGRHLLVARLPGALQWTFPAAEKPPFRKTPREVFPLRVGTERFHDVTPLRPLSEGIRVVVMRGHRAHPIEEKDPLEPPDASAFRRDADGSIVLSALPLRALPMLLITPAGDAPVVVEMSLRRPDGVEEFRRLQPPFAGTSPCVLPLVDLPAWPELELRRLRVTGAADLATVANLPEPIRISDPRPGSLLRLADANRPFRLDGLPEGTQALKITMLTAGGAGLPVVIDKTEFTFLDLVGDPGFAYVLRAGLKLSSETIYLMIEALGSAASPGLILGRTHLTPFRIRLE